MVLEILDHRGQVTGVIRVVEGVAVPQDEGTTFLIESMGSLGHGVQLEDRFYVPTDGDAFLRAVAAHLDGCYSVPRLRAE